MNTELRRRKSHDIPIELLHEHILATVEPDYKEFSNAWKSLGINKRTANSLIEELCTIEKRLKTSTTAADSSAFVENASTTKSQFLAIKTTSSKPSGSKKSYKDNRENQNCFHCGKVGHLRNKCRKLKADNNKSVVTDSTGSPSVDNTKRSALSAVRVNSMRLVDKWVWDSGASHHMTANKKYFATYKTFSAPVNISLADKGTIMAYGFGQVNIEMLVDVKWCPVYLEDVWYVPDKWRHLFSVWSATEHGISVVMKVKVVMFPCDGQFVVTGGWIRTHTPWTRTLWSQESQRKLKLHWLQKPFSCGMNVLAIKTSVMCEKFWNGWKSIWVWQNHEACVMKVLGKAHRKPFTQQSDWSQFVGELIQADVNRSVSAKLIRGTKYYVCFNDYYSKYHKVYFIKQNNEFPSVYVHY